jgi:hypothetical protein
MNRIIGGFAAGVVVVMAMLASAEDKKPVTPVKPPEEVWLEGEIIDLPSYIIDGSHGKDHYKMAKVHVKAGSPAAMLTFDGKLYIITPYNREGFEPLQNAGEVIRMKAVTYERDGVKIAIAKDVKKLPPDYKGKDGDGGDRGKMGGGGGADAGGHK